MQLDSTLRDEITPKNILMIGPTGVGKTEIARRLAKLADAPFLKVEATKFTEVGYVGRDVESIIRDLADMAIKMLREKEMKRHENRALTPPRIVSSMPCCHRPGISRKTASHGKIPRPASCSAKNCGKVNWMTRRSRSTSVTPPPAWRSWPLPAWRK